MQHAKRVFYFAMAFMLTLQVHAQTTGPLTPDTLHLDLDSAEHIFITRNFSLLAQRYNIDVNRALILQARLFPNPNLSYAQGFYNPKTKQIFAFGSNGEVEGGLSQLIQLAGKRNKQIRIAQANTQLAEYQFFDLLRTLKYTLRTDFFNIYYLQQSAKLYDEEISSLQQVVQAFNELQGKGYISQKEVVRIKAQLYSLQSEYSDLINQINDLQSELRLVIQMKNVYIQPEIDSGMINSLDPAKYSLNTLLDSAYQNRTDLLIARQNTEVNKLNYSYQKALAVPDVTLNAAYDQQGSYVNNFNSLGFSIDLPFFNRNQGNIKSAKAQIAASNATQQSTQATVEENVYRALQKAFDLNRLYAGMDQQFASEFSRLLHEVLINYKKRNLGLLDFLDFYDSYKQNMLQINAIRFHRVSAFEDLNFYTGTALFN
jgi:cobalt-zinc-cadmium efflux system outer membrane protein